MNEELFGELHEEEQYGLFGLEHYKQYFLYSVSDRTLPNNRLKIEPVFDDISTAVSQYKVTDDLGSILMVGTREECDAYLYCRSSNMASVGHRKPPKLIRSNNL